MTDGLSLKKVCVASVEETWEKDVLKIKYLQLCELF